MRKHSVVSKILSFSLALLLLFGMVPASATDVVTSSVQESLPTEVVTSVPENNGSTDPTEAPTDAQDTTDAVESTDVPTEAPTEIPSDTEVSVTETPTNESEPEGTEPTEKPEDKTKPELKVEYDTEAWVKEIVFNVTAYDEESGLKEDGFKVFLVGTDDEAEVKAEVKKATVTGDEYTVKLNEADNGIYKIVATNTIGLTATSDEITIDKVDKAAPIANDFTVRFAASQSAVDKVLRFLSFGLYTNKSNLAVTVTVNANGGAPISEITLFGGSSDGETVMKETAADNKNGTYSSTFELSKSEVNLIKVLEFVAKDEAGNESEKLALTDGMTVYAKEDIISLDMNGELYDVVYSVEAPEFVYVSGPENGAVVTSSDECNFKVTIKDELSGISNVIEAYFDKADNFDFADGAYSTKDETSALAVSTSDANVTAAGKTTEFTVSAEAVLGNQEGEHVFMLTAENNCGNVGVYTVVVYVDNTAPVINVVVPEEWTNEDIKVEFDVTDNIAGVETVTANGEACEVVDGKWSFTATSNEDYVIEATDKVGNVGTATVKFNIEKDAPKIELDAILDKWTNEDVTVSFSANDALSGVDKVTANGMDCVTTDDEKWSFVATSDEEYTIKVTDKAGNSAEETVQLKIDKAAPVISQVMFAKKETAIDQILKFLTFGIYSNNTVKMTVTAEDAGSNIRYENAIAVYYDGEELDSFAPGEYNLVPDTVYEAKKLEIFVYDNVDNEFKTTLNDIRGKIKDTLADGFELVFTNKAPVIVPDGEIAIYGWNAEGTNVYSATGDENTPDLTFAAKIKDTLSGIDVDSIKVLLNSEEVEADITLSSSTDDEKCESVEIVYETGHNLPNGWYTFEVVAKNNSGNEIKKSTTVGVDNTAPVITIVATGDESGWYNEEVGVQFYVSDTSSNDEVSGGDVNIVVTNEAGEEIEFYYGMNGAPHSFYATEDEVYTITATDVFGHTTSSSTDVPVDKLAPSFGEISYSNGNNEIWTKDDITISIPINDIGKSGLDISSIQFTPPIRPDAYRFVNGVLVFDIARYSSFKITVKDNAGNENSIETAVAKYDNKAPEIKEVSFAVEENPSVLDKVLNVLTFGIYSNTKVIMTVTAHDEAMSSGINTFDAVYEEAALDVYGEPIEVPVNTGAVMVTKSFVLPINNLQAYNPESIIINVVDLATNENLIKNLKDLENEELYINGTDLENDFEVVVSDSTPDEISITGVGGVNPFAAEGKMWFQSDVVVKAAVKNELYKIYDIKVYLNDNDITDVCDFSEDKLGKDDNKVSEVDITINTASVDELVNKTKETDGANTIKIEVTGNNGNMGYEVFENLFYVDNVAPVITAFEFEGKESVEPLGSDNTFAYRDIDYGYFFDGATPLTVTAEDNGSGVSKIHLVGCGADSAEDFELESTEIADNKCTFEIPADFKGTVYAYATDNVETDGKAYYTDNVVVNDDTDDSKIDFSFEDDNCVDINLYNGEVKFGFAVQDYYSGLKSIYYAICESDGTILDEFTVSPDEIENTEKDENLYTFAEISDSIVITEEDIAKYNKSGLYVVVKAVSNTGQEFNIETKKISIDTQKPVIENITFAHEETVIDKILSFLTFGIYSNAKVVMTVEATDAAVSSGIVTFEAKYNDAGLKVFGEMNTVTNEDGSVVVTNKFELPVNNNAAYDPANIIINVVDKATNDNEVKVLSELKALITDNDGVEFEDTFEIVVSDSTIDEITITSVDGTNQYNANDGKVWYQGDVVVKANVKNELYKIQNVKIYLNNNDITKFCEFDKDLLDKDNGVFTESGNKDSKNVSEVNITIDTASVDEFVNKASNSNGANTIKIEATGNNGNKGEQVFENLFYVDDVAPVITYFEFEGEDQESPDKAEEDLKVVETPYGYFFNKATNVKVTAEDNGCGVEVVYLMGRSVVDGISKPFDYSKVDGEDNTYLFTVPADFKGTIYAYAVDNVKNDGPKYYPENAVLESEDVHETVIGSSVEILPENIINEEKNLYNGDVNVKLSIYDNYSGLNNVTYTVKAPGMENYVGTLTSRELLLDKDSVATTVTDDKDVVWTIVDRDEISGKPVNLIKKIETTITLKCADGTNKNFDYNDLTVEIKAQDNVFYDIDSITSETFSIDTIIPEISVAYNDVVANKASNGRDYYKDTRIATVTVKERNFDPTAFDWTKVLNAEGAVPTFVAADNWVAGSSNSDDTTHTATVAFETDGVYSVTLNYTDMAQNVAAQYGTDEFTIDTINPVVSVTYDNNNVQNERYYAAGRTATVKIVEHNFSAEDMYLVYTATATKGDNSTVATPPALSAWTSNGDTHTATITFSEDGKYEFAIEYKDMALREAEKFEQDTFYVDTVIAKPVFNNVENNKAYNETIAPQIVYTDDNYSTSTYTLTNISYDYEKGANKNDVVSHLYASEVPSATGMTVTYSDFPIEELNDGIYKLVATITDRAGNTESAEIMFSVNRFGSTFMLGSDETINLVEKTYTTNAPDVVIVEINVNPVTNQTVSLSYNTKTVDLASGTDYKIGSTGNDTSWYRYEYTIDRSNFVDEGNYILTVSSVDKFEKQVSNRTANDTGEIERNCPVSFVVDKTAPVISIEGAESGEVYPEASRTLKIQCLDTNIDKESLVITHNDKVLQPGIDYVADDSLVGEISVDLLIDTGAEEGKHTVKVSVKDLASNASEDSVEEFVLAARFITRYLNSPAAIIGTIGVLVAAAVIIILVSRKKKRDKE